MKWKDKREKEGGGGRRRRRGWAFESLPAASRCFRARHSPQASRSCVGGTACLEHTHRHSEGRLRQQQDGKLVQEPFTSPPRPMPAPPPPSPCRPFPFPFPCATATQSLPVFPSCPPSTFSLSSVYCLYPPLPRLKARHATRTLRRTNSPCLPKAWWRFPACLANNRYILCLWKTSAGRAPVAGSACILILCFETMSFC